MNNNKKWTTFTFVSPRVCRITNLFKYTNVKVAFRCHNTLGRLTKPTKDINTPPHNKWGIYQLTCNSCNLSYVGQTSLNLKIRFQEHIRYVRNNNPQSAFAQHILHSQPEYGQMNNIMKGLKPLINRSMLTSYKQFYIQTFHQENKLILEQYPGEQNLLFQTSIHPRPTAWKDQSCYNLRSTHSSILHALNFQTSSNSRYVQYLSFFSITRINTPAMHWHTNMLTQKRNFTHTSTLTYTTATTQMKYHNF